MTAHLEHGKNESVTNVDGNTRNGYSGKTLKDDFGDLPLVLPRNRKGSFEPQLE